MVITNHMVAVNCESAAAVHNQREEGTVAAATAALSVLNLEAACTIMLNWLKVGEIGRWNT